eukprot:3264979-Pyramimonas_sp.AAC.1
MSTEGTAPLVDTRMKHLKRTKTPFSGLQRHESILLLRLDDPAEPCQSNMLRSTRPQFVKPLHMFTIDVRGAKARAGFWKRPALHL